MFKRKPSVSGLSRAREAESHLVALVEARIDSGDSNAGLIEELIAECRSRAVALPRNPSWHFLFGRFAMAAGDPIEARDELERAILLDTRDPRIAAHLGLWYEAALLAACGERANVDLPRLVGPALSADASRFALLDEQLPAEALSARAQELLSAALQFALPRKDVRLLRAHMSLVRNLPLPSGLVPENVTQIRHAG